MAAFGTLTFELGAASALLGFSLGKTTLFGRRLVETPALELCNHSLRVPLPSLYQSFKITSSVFQCRSSPRCPSTKILTIARHSCPAASPIIHDEKKAVEMRRVVHVERGAAGRRSGMGPGCL